MKKKKSVKKNKSVKRIRVLKVQRLEPEKHVVELEIHGPIVLPEHPIPEELIEIESEPEHPWLNWLRSWWQ